MKDLGSLGTWNWVSGLDFGVHPLLQAHVSTVVTVFMFLTFHSEIL